MALQHLRSNTASKRPTPASMADGQLAVNTNATSPGLFFKDAAGDLVKVGPVHVGTSAPNSSPAGSSGNALGEQWLDTSGGGYVFKVWDGSAWRSETGQFVDVTGDTMTGDLTISGADLVMSNGEIIAATGTAAAPSITFTGDTNTGLYSPGADQVAISTGGTGRLFVDADGRLLAGSSVAGDGDADNLNLADATNPGITLRGSSTGTGSIYFADGTTGDDLKRGQIRYSHADNALSFATQATEKLRITSDGKVGLGTTSPQNLFSLGLPTATTSRILGQYGNNESPTLEVGVGQSSTFRGGMRIAVTDTGAGSVGDSVVSFHTTKDGGGTVQRLTIDQDGNVGIGTQTPDYKLSVESAGNNYVSVANTLNSAAALFGVNSQGAVITGRNTPTGTTAKPIQFVTGTDERARIDSSGRLLVGTSTSTTQGNVTGDIQIGKAGGCGFSMSRWTDNTFAPIVNLGKSRGTSVGSNAVVQSGDELGRIEFSGDDGTDLVSIGANISAQVDGTPGANDMPGRLVFSTTADGASSPTERMRITSDAYVRLASGTGGIQFNGDTAAANALDDYEEGTWTVTFYDAASGGNTSATTGTGHYTKIGNVVRAAFFVQNIDTSGMTAGNLLHYTLPVFHGAGTETGSAFVGITTIAGGVAAYLGANTSRALLVESSSGSAYTLLTVSDLTSGSADIAVTLTYKAA